jgi:hypothetical protein
MSLQYRSILAAALAGTAALAGSALAACMPHATVDVTVKLTTDDIGFDSFQVMARGLPPNRSFTVFLLQQVDSPFGAAEYIGDITSDAYGDARKTFRLIVHGAFCLGKGGPVTPFDGDDEAGVQAFNSRNAAPLPAP